MSRKVSVVILTLALISIITLTVYILCNKGIRVEVPKYYKKQIELVNENIAKDEASMLFNVNLNDNRHRFKIVYQYEKIEKQTNLVANIYLDGKNIFKKVVYEKIKTKKLNDLFKNDNYKSYLRKDKSSLAILKDGASEYLVFYLADITSKAKEYYFIINDKGQVLNEKGILKLDKSKIYTDKEDKDLNLYYDENQSLAKIKNNQILFLLPVEEEKEIKLEEYSSYIKKGKLEKELINSYENIKVSKK